MPVTPSPPWKDRLYRIIFQSDTRAGWWFDVALFGAIILSVVVVMLESVPQLRAKHYALFIGTEWVLTILFTIEYVLRLICVRHRWRYARSFFGIIDLISILPTYLTVFFASAHYLLIVRIMRLLRIFRILKLMRYWREADVLMAAMGASRHKIAVFLWTVLTAVVVIGALMYIVEGEEHGFTSIPRSVYWAIVTLTTVGYGDISPSTPLGQLIACVVMIMGYGIIAVPTGIVSVEIHQAVKRDREKRRCSNCGALGHTVDAAYCRACGRKLQEGEKEPAGPRGDYHSASGAGQRVRPKRRRR